MSTEDPQLDERAGLPRIGRKPHERGTSNSNARGSSYNRRARREWLMENYASDVPGFVRCYRCGRKLNDEALTVDRIRPGCQGGTYKRDNIRPCCSLCNTITGATTRSDKPMSAVEEKGCLICGTPIDPTSDEVCCEEDTLLEDLQKQLEIAERVIEAGDVEAALYAELKLLQAKYDDLDRLYSAQRIELASAQREATKWKKRAPKETTS